MDPGEHSLEAFPRKPPRAPVVAAAMVAVDQRASIRQGVADIVAEGKFLELEAVGPEQCLMCDSAKCNDHFQAWHGGQLCFEMSIALTNFSCRWLVGRWQASNGIGYAAVTQLHGRIGP